MGRVRRADRDLWDLDTPVSHGYPLRMWQVQARLNATTHDGWESSREVPTLIVASRSDQNAAIRVACVAWDMSSREAYPGRRETFATVVEIDPEHGQPREGAEVSFVKVIFGYGGMSAYSGPSYGEVSAWMREGN